MSGHYNGWIGVDFDGTLAEYNGWKGPTHLGIPIAPMVARVHKWLEDGREVRIFTARVYAPPNDAEAQKNAALGLLHIQDWCERHIGCILPITCTKDYGMIELWDDRCVQVTANTGERMDGVGEQK